jgi:hypothetical protein
MTFPYSPLPPNRSIVPLPGFGMTGEKDLACSYTSRTDELE